MMILTGARAARAALLSAFLLFPMFAPAASAGKSAVAVPGKPLVEVDAPGVATNSFEYDSGYIEERSGSGRASPGGLHASAYSYGAPVLVESTASFTSLHDTTFDYEPGDLVSDPTDWVSFILSGALNGTVTATDAGGFGGGRSP